MSLYLDQHSQNTQRDSVMTLEKGPNWTICTLSESSHGSRFYIITAEISAFNYLSAVKTTGVDENNTTYRFVDNSKIKGHKSMNPDEELDVCDSEFEEFLVDAFGF